jgi:hypothetical protein
MNPNSRKVLAVLALGALSCGGVGTSRETARDQATRVSCDWYLSAPCQGINPYTSRDMCEIDVRAKWENAWPPADCDGKIDTTQLNICLSAISATDCSSPLDILNTLANKCPKTKVCGATSSADGGA